jgi:pilus assembly protein Flp/PilA
MRIPTRILRSVVAVRGDRGTTAVEYALVASLIAVVIIVGVVLLGANLLGLFDETASSFADAT